MRVATGCHNTLVMLTAKPPSVVSDVRRVRGTTLASVEPELQSNMSVKLEFRVQSVVRKSTRNAYHDAGCCASAVSILSRFLLLAVDRRFWISSGQLLFLRSVVQVEWRIVKASCGSALFPCRANGRPSPARWASPCTEQRRLLIGKKRKKICKMQTRRL